MSPVDRSVKILCPAKINLSLAITGKRDDGFHALSSIVSQTAFGDEMELQWQRSNTPAKDIVVVDGAIIPEGENSVLLALQQFRRLTGFSDGFFNVSLRKKIPIAAGLGGGSSDAVGAIRALAELFPDLLNDELNHRIAASVGSDCPLFLHDGPVLMEGRGEQITPLSGDFVNRLSGKPVILFKPRFTVNTAEAYKRLAQHALYTPGSDAARLLEDWRGSANALPARHNDFERLMEIWMPSLAIVLDRLRNVHGLEARLSGSGSACFAFPQDRSSDNSIIREEMQRAWGEVYWLETTTVR